MSIVNVVHRTECIEKGLEYIDIDSLTILCKEKKGLLKWARKYDIILVSANINKKVIGLAGKPLGAISRLPIQVAENASIFKKVEELKRTVRFRTKKYSWFGTSVGVETLKEEEIRQNLVKTINFLISLLPKGWLNIKSLTLKTTMGKPTKIY
jgi:large subunit ribosomal protein L10Ae